MLRFLVWISFIAIIGRTSVVLASDEKYENSEEDATNTASSFFEEDDEHSVESRNDLPELSDEVLRSFFDFVNEDGEQQQTTNVNKGSEKNSHAAKQHRTYKYPVKKDLRHSYYRHEASHGSLTPYSVTPGTHYRDAVNKYQERKTGVHNFTKDTHSMVVGPYQVSVVDATNPLLSSLGLKRHHLEKLAGAPIPALSYSSNTSTDLTSSASSQSSSYAEYPNRHQSAPSYASYQKAPLRYEPEYDRNRPYSNRPHAGNDEYGPPLPHADYPPPPPPPPQRSYQSEFSATSSYKYPHGSSASNSYKRPASTLYTGNRHPQPDNWKPSGTGGYADFDDNEKEKHSSDYNREFWKQPDSLYPPHPPYRSPSEYQDQKSAYSPPKPTLGVLSPSYPKSGSSYTKPSYSPSDHHSSGYSSPPAHRPSSSKTPSRAGSLPHDSYHSQYAQAPSKPAISISFKAKAPSHGVSIPINLNPLDVVKKIALPLSALNPLANKKVTIGITIENKDSHSSHY